MEIANGGHGLLNPGGMGPYCEHLGWRYDAASGGCKSTPAPAGTECEPDNPCLTDGTCSART